MKDLTFEQIADDIKARRFAPVYLLMGEEPYFIDELTDLLIETVVPESERDFNLIIRYGSEVNAMAIIDTARSFPMMSEYQLIVVREAQQMKDIETLAHYVKTPQKTTVLVINYKYKPFDKRKALAVSTDKIGILFESKKIKDYQMPAYIISFLKQRSTSIDQKAAQMLADYLGNDLSRLSKELDKLALLMPEKGAKKITPELVEENVGISKEYNNYELLKAVVTKNVLKSNRIIQYFEQNPKENPIQPMLSVLFNYFSNLLICQYAKDRSERGVMNTLGLNKAFQARDYLDGMRLFSPMKVFNLISDIRTTDARSKGVDNPSAGNGELMKELIYKILH